jgi:hypothetical protein
MLQAYSIFSFNKPLIQELKNKLYLQYPAEVYIISKLCLLVIHIHALSILLLESYYMEVNNNKRVYY